MKIKVTTILLLILILLSGCVTYNTRIDNLQGSPAKYEDVETAGSISGIGIESQDIVSMTDRMVRDMLSAPSLAARPSVCRVIVDEKYFINESSSIINKKLISERLMVHLNRAATNRMQFIERRAAEMVENERRLKEQGYVSEGTIGNAEKPAGADFRLTGRIISLDSVNTNTGSTSRYHQISFKMVDLETGIVAWSGIYEFKKTAQDDIIYR